MKKYKCHKEVHAAKIVEIHEAAHILHLENTTGFEKDRDWFLKHQPHVGGYYVQYEDGYSSYSPAEAFEGGYTEMEEIA